MIIYVHNCFSHIRCMYIFTYMYVGNRVWNTIQYTHAFWNCFMQIWIITNKQICICIFKKKNVFVLSIYRHLAYRRFVRWIWHCLGKNNRKILPSCVVNKIRTAFPSQQYCGFKYPSCDSEVNICGIIFLLINSYMYLKQTTMHLVSSQMIVKLLSNNWSICSDRENPMGVILFFLSL